MFMRGDTDSFKYSSKFYSDIFAYVKARNYVKSEWNHCECFIDERCCIYLSNDFVIVGTKEYIWPELGVLGHPFFRLLYT